MLNPREEYNSRVATERAKALDKYGVAGQLPGGDPDLDVLDYLINEVVGLKRYAQMLFARKRLWPAEFHYRTAQIADRLASFSKLTGEDLISLRQGLLARGLELGKGERRRDVP